MEIKQLTYFVQVCKDKSFTKAAENLYITQQGLSMAISRMESELGCSLFRRAHNSIVMTEHAEFLLPNAERILELDSACNKYFVGLFQSPTLKICMLSEVLGISPPQVQRLLSGCDLYNQFCVKYMFSTALDCEKLVLERTCDFGICSGPIDSSQFSSDFLLRRRQCFLVHKKHPLAQYDDISIMQLKNLNLIHVGAAHRIRKNFEVICQKYGGFTPNVKIESDWLSLTYNLVRSNPDLVGRSFDYFADTLNDSQIKVIYLNDVDLFWDIYLIRRIDEKMTPAQAAFRKVFLSFFNDYATQ